MENNNNKKEHIGTSLVVQWLRLRASLVAQSLRIRLPMQGTRVRDLVWEDPTCRGATKPVRHNYWACTLEPASHNYWSPHAITTEACAPRACALQQEKPSEWEAPAMRSPGSLLLKKAHAEQRRPNAAKQSIYIYIHTYIYIYMYIYIYIYIYMYVYIYKSI